MGKLQKRPTGVRSCTPQRNYTHWLRCFRPTGSEIGPSVSQAGSMAEARLDRIEMLLEKMAMSMTSQNPSQGGSQQGGANYSGYPGGR